MDESRKKTSFFDPKIPLTPTFIPLIFWCGIIVCVLKSINSFLILAMINQNFRETSSNPIGFSDLVGDFRVGLIARAIAFITLGPLFWFVICELIAGFFHITKNIETLKQTKTQ